VYCLREATCSPPISALSSASEPGSLPGKMYSADGFEATSRQTLLPRELLQYACDLVAGLKD
jgi:hypothetical protein